MTSSGAVPTGAGGGLDRRYCGVTGSGAAAKSSAASLAESCGFGGAGGAEGSVGAALDRIAVGAASDAASTGFCGRSSLGAASTAGVGEPAVTVDSGESSALLPVDPDEDAPVEVGAAVDSSVAALGVCAEDASACCAAAVCSGVACPGVACPGVAFAAVVLAAVFEVTFLGVVVRVVVRLAAVGRFGAASTSGSGAESAGD